jgi:uncharacterized protein (UPF0332 family)
VGKARKFIESSKVLLEINDYDSVVSRTYYAMFLITEALLLTKNLVPKSHSGLISLFGEHFVKTNIFSKEMGRQLNRAYDKRLIGDYGTSIIINKNEAQGLLNIGQDFVENIAEYLEKNKNL